MQLIKRGRVGNELFIIRQLELDNCRKCPCCGSYDKNKMEECEEYFSYHEISYKQRKAELGDNKKAKRKDLQYMRYRCYKCNAEWRSNLYINPYTNNY